MANHLHKQIRDLIGQTLTGLSQSAHVYADRDAPLDTVNMPAFRVDLDEEDSQDITFHSPTPQERTLKLVVECCAKGVSGVSDTLDALSKDAEVALAAALALGGKPLLLSYEGMQKQRELLDEPVGTKSLKFSVSFSAMNNAPDALI